MYSNFYFEGPPSSADDEPARAEYRCGSWKCYCCGYRMRQNLVEEIARVTKERPSLSRLLTLTLDPKYAPDDEDEQHQYLTRRWNALRTVLTDEYGSLSYIWVREEGESGNPHLHIIVDRYIPQEWLSSKWDELGGGRVVDIRRIEHLDRAAHYIGKYLTKEAMTGLPKGTRRYGSSSDIDLDVRGSGGDDEASAWRLRMSDEQVTTESGEAITREPDSIDFVLQREWGGPVPPD